MLPEQLIALLERKKIHYVTIKHSPAYTAQEVAAAAHIAGKEFAKTVIVKIDGQLAMIVEPANVKLNLSVLKKLTHANSVSIAKESEFRDKFPDCELGAMPPFGNLFGLPVYVTGALAEDDQIAFNAGSHTELIKMKYKDFEKIVHPKVIGMPK
jgi:Ala-tRNA(Pro) deacylase